MTLSLTPEQALMPMVLWAGFIGVIIASVLVLDRDWKLVPTFVVRRFIWAGLIIGLVSVRLSAVDLFVECNWDALVDAYGTAGAWIMWVMAGC